MNHIWYMLHSFHTTACVYSACHRHIHCIYDIRQSFQWSVAGLTTACSMSCIFWLVVAPEGQSLAPEKPFGSKQCSTCSLFSLISANLFSDKVAHHLKLTQASIELWCRSLFWCCSNMHVGRSIYKSPCQWTYDSPNTFPFLTAFLRSAGN